MILFKKNEYLNTIYFFLILGIFFRTYRYLSNASLWVDEAKLALNIVNSSFAELVGPLIHPPQFAPVGFVLLTKMITSLSFENELILRLFPFVCGILSLFIFASICKKILDPKVSLLAVSLFCVSEYLIQYSAEFKQYSSDVFFSLFTIYMALRIDEKADSSGKTLPYLVLGLFGAVFLFFSYPVALILGVTNCFLLYKLYKSGQKQLFLVLIGISVVWLCIFIGNYKLSVISSHGFNKELHDFWKAGFIHFPPTSPGDIRQYFDMIKEIFEECPLKLFYPGLILFGFLIGCMVGYRKTSHHFFLILAPVLLTIIVSMMGKYPFKGRLILFLTPFFIILISLGVAYLAEVLGKDSKAMALLLIIIIFIQPIIYQMYRVHQPKMGEEIKEVLTYYQANKTPDELLYIYYGAQDAVEFYKKRFLIHDAEYIKGSSGRDNWMVYNNDLNKLSGKGRVWLLFSHVIDWNGVNEEKYFINFLNNMGKQIKSFQAYGASIYLYEL